MGATAILSEFASATKFAQISPEAVAATKRHILDCIGVGLAATVEPAGKIVLDVTRHEGGAPHARVLGSNLRTNAVGAAWANGSLSHLLHLRRYGFLSSHRMHIARCHGDDGAVQFERRRSRRRRLHRPRSVRAHVALGSPARTRIASPRLPSDFRDGPSAAAAAAGSIVKVNPRRNGRRDRARRRERRRSH